MIAQLDSDYIKTRPTKVYNRVVSYALFEGRPLTTSGRWINPLVFSLLNLSKNSLLSKKVDKPIFILGIGRSGTTLLGTLLSMHRSVGFLNEPKAIWHSLYPYEDLIGSYTEKRAHYRLDSDSVDEKLIRAAHNIYGTYLRVVGAQRVVDKYPELVFRTDFVKEIFPDARFIFLARNGWNTCTSIDTWSQKNGMEKAEETHDWWGRDNRKWNLLLSDIAALDPYFKDHIRELNGIRDHQNMAALEWVLTMQEGLKLRADPQMLTVKFEDLTCNPDIELKRILNFCELKEDKKFITYAEKVIKPVPDRDKFYMHPAIEPAFKKVMVELDYERN